MLTINRVKIVLKSEHRDFGYESCFKRGLNLISSKENTCGKSSVIAAIYYCLGMEELLGGQGGKVLPSAYKSTIECDGEVVKILESSAYLEINNGIRTVTLYRTIKADHREDSLISVYDSPLSGIHDHKTTYEDFFVHGKNSARNEKGFFTFLEDFLHLQLPAVPTTDGSTRKLYLQLIFSALFIEQKQGWSNILARIPFLGIRESKRRVIEFLLQLDIFENEQQKEKCKSDEILIRNEWKSAIERMKYIIQTNGMDSLNLPLNPRILSREDIVAITAIHPVSEKTIDEIIAELEVEQKKFSTREPIIRDNYEELQSELEKVEADIRELTSAISELENAKYAKQNSIAQQQHTLDTLRIDLRNNQDAAKLKRLGSEIEGSTFSDCCPVCHQHVDDSLLIAKNYVAVMGIDENIAHLQAQIQMLEYSIAGRQRELADTERNIRIYRDDLYALQRLGKSIRSDLFAVNSELSETLIRKRIINENRISSLQELTVKMEHFRGEVSELSKKWANMLATRESLPKATYSDDDKKKLDALRQYFVDNLKKFGYKSVTDIASITLSPENYMPMVADFDMKFDSSASDNIRVIWAYTLALLQVSIVYEGNHPSVIIFDEPDQHSIVVSDLNSLFQTILELKDACQVIVGITEKDSDTQAIITAFSPAQCQRNEIVGKAFAPLVSNLNSQSSQESSEMSGNPDMDNVEKSVNE